MSPQAAYLDLQVKGENEKVNVKRLPKKAAPPRFGRKLTARQQELASHICVGEWAKQPGRRLQSSCGIVVFR